MGAGQHGMGIQVGVLQQVDQDQVNFSYGALLSFQG